MFMVPVDIFKLHDLKDTDGFICIHGLSVVLSEQIKALGGCRDFERAPVHLFVLKRLLPSFNFAEEHVILTVKRSKHKVKVPLRVDAELAYLIGLVLGNGSLAGHRSTERGGWRIHFCGSDESFVKVYASMVGRLFGIKARLKRITRQNRKPHFEAVFASKVVHRLLTNVFEIPAGVKHNK